MIGRLRIVVLLLAAMSGSGLAQDASQKAGPSAGAPPSREQVLQLMSAMGVQQSVDSSLRETQAKFKDAARDSFTKKNPNADEATLKKLDEVFESTHLFTFQDIAEVVIPVYQKNLSAVDVQAGIDFYNSESGKRLLQKVPEILRESNDVGGQLVQQKLEAYSDELEQKLEIFQNQVNQARQQAAQPDAAPQPDTAPQPDPAPKTEGKQ